MQKLDVVDVGDLLVQLPQIDDVGRQNGRLAAKSGIIEKFLIYYIDI